MKKVLFLLLSLVLSVSMFACSTGEKDTPKNEAAEVVIIGGGAAGMSAAIKAAEQGVQVVLLEKHAFLGGASIMASAGINAGGADLQNETEEPYTADMFFDYAKSWDYGYDRIGYRVTPVRDDMAETFAYRSAEAANWIASLGLEMKTSSNSHSIQLVTKENGAFGVLYVSALKAKLEEFENIEVRLESKATEIVMNDSGAVSGVKIEGKDTSYTIDTTAVILASGGYANAGSDFWSVYAPEWDGYYVTGAAGATGDGIVMADAVGAKLDGMDAVTCTPLAVGEANKAGALGISSNKKGAVLVNKEGLRFVNEALGTAPLMEALKVQTDKEAWLIADQTVFAENSEFTKMKDNGTLIEAESVEALAKELNIDAVVLSNTLTTYAENLANGADEFQKEGTFSDMTTAPYYAVLVKPAKRITTGGIVITGKAEVVNENDEIITGLYAAGEVTAYGAHPLSAATIFGRQAADSVVEFLGK